MEQSSLTSPKTLEEEFVSLHLQDILMDEGVCIIQQHNKPNKRNLKFQDDNLWKGAFLEKSIKNYMKHTNASYEEAKKIMTNDEQIFMKVNEILSKLDYTEFNKGKNGKNNDRVFEVEMINQGNLEYNIEMDDFFYIDAKSTK